jgi:hypothetical protein
MEHFIMRALHNHYQSDRRPRPKVECLQKKLWKPLPTPTQNVKGNLFLQTLKANRKKK